MLSSLSELIKPVLFLLLAAIGFAAFSVLMILAGWNNWLLFRPEPQLDKTVVAFPEKGQVSEVMLYEFDFAVPGVHTVWESAMVSFDSNPEFQLLSQLTIQDVEELGFVRADLKGPANSPYYRLLNSQFHFENGKLKSCQIDCASFKTVRFQLAEGSKIFSLPVSESEFSRLLADARKRNRTKK